MKVTSAQLVTSAPALENMPEVQYPEVAFLGRSNVGKSSLINALLGRRSLARTSSQPGKTRLFNFYLVNESFYLVDMPGYGYARFAQAERLRLRSLICRYITERESLRAVIHAVDFRHEPSSDDKEFSSILLASNVPFLVVATKCDKVPISRHHKHQKVISTSLGIPQEQVLVTSAEVKRGLDDVWARLNAPTA